MSRETRNLHPDSFEYCCELATRNGEYGELDAFGQTRMQTRMSRRKGLLNWLRFVNLKVRLMMRERLDLRRCLELRRDDLVRQVRLLRMPLLYEALNWALPLP